MFVTIELHKQPLTFIHDMRPCRSSIESALRKHLTTEISWDVKMTDKREIVFYTGKLDTDSEVQVIEDILTDMRERYQDKIKVIWKMSDA